MGSDNIIKNMYLLYNIMSTLTPVQHLLKDKEAIEAIMKDIQKIITKIIDRIKKNRDKYKFNLNDYYNLHLYNNIYDDIISKLESLKNEKLYISAIDDDELKMFCEWYDKVESLLRNQNEVVKILLKDNPDYSKNPMDNIDRTKFDVEIITK